MNSSLLAMNQLSIHQRDAMFTLFDEHFENVSREQFESDLRAKHWVILLRDERLRVYGFTTLRYEKHNGMGEPCAVLSSGDTIVHPDIWGSSLLFRAWLHGVLSLRDRYRDRQHTSSDNGTGESTLYWLLLTSGFRTYRFLPVFWRSYFPRFDTPTPPVVQHQMDALAQATYGEAYDAETGVVRFSRPQRLRPHLAGIPRSRSNDPHIAFFSERNPGHKHGDELVCLAKINEHNLTRAGKRILRAANDRSATQRVSV